MTVVLVSVIVCPQCGYAACETMPTDACMFFYDCKGCGAVLRPKAGDCCVFCSFGSVPCPPAQDKTPTLLSSVILTDKDTGERKVTPPPWPATRRRRRRIRRE